MVRDVKFFIILNCPRKISFFFKRFLVYSSGHYDGRLLTVESFPLGIDLRDHCGLISDLIKRGEMLNKDKQNN